MTQWNGPQIRLSGPMVGHSDGYSSGMGRSAKSRHNRFWLMLVSRANLSQLGTGEPPICSGRICWVNLL